MAEWYILYLSSISTLELTLEVTLRLLLVGACLLPTSVHFSRYTKMYFPRGRTSLHYTEHSSCHFRSSLLNFIYLSAQTFQYTDGRGTNCTNTTNSPSTNFFAETYALGSRCVEQGRQWTWSTATQIATPTTYGAGCYQVSSVQNLKLTYVMMSSVFSAVSVWSWWCGHLPTAPGLLLCM